MYMNSAGNLHPSEKICCLRHLGRKKRKGKSLEISSGKIVVPYAAAGKEEGKAEFLCLRRRCKKTSCSFTQGWPLAVIYRESVCEEWISSEPYGNQIHPKKGTKWLCAVQKGFGSKIRQPECLAVNGDLVKKKAVSRVFC